MPSEAAAIESASKAGAAEPRLTGVSAFVAKVLDQLSLSAWLPGVLFAVSVTVLARFHTMGSIDLAAVVANVSQNWLAVLVWTVPTLLLSVLVIQASSFAAIQFLEGYGAARGPSSWCRTGLIRWHAAQLRWLEKRIARTRQRAFDASAHRWSDQPSEVVMAMRSIAYGLEEPTLNATHQARLDELDWETECDPWRMVRLAEMEERLKEFPDPHRILPTRLGNVLRATEDRLENGGREVAQFALRRRGLTSSRVQMQHDQFRSRLDMYSTLTVVSVILAAVSVAMLATAGIGWPSVVFVSALFVLFAVVAYRAAIASARGYCTILRVMDAAEG